MALRNSVKAACLSFDDEQPRPPDPAVTAWRNWEDELRAMVAALPSKVCLDAPAPESDAPQAEDHASLSSFWHARAEALRAMADKLPSKPSGTLMPKIAAIYDQFACEAGWAEPDTLTTADPLAPPDALASDDPAPEPERGDPAAEEAPQAIAPQAVAPEPAADEPGVEVKPQAALPEPQPEDPGVAPEPAADEPDVEVKPQAVALPEPQPEEPDIEEKPQAITLPEPQPEEPDFEEKPQALAAEPALDEFEFEIEEMPQPPKQLVLKLDGFGPKTARLSVAPPAAERVASLSDLDVEEELQTAAPAIVPRTAQHVAFARRPLPRRRG